MTAVSKIAPPKQAEKPEPEEELVSKPAPKPGFFPTGLSRAIFLSSLILSLVATPFLLAHRYELIAVPRSENALVFRVNTMTGDVSLCSAVQCTAVTEKAGGN
jgi:hypothetical protein